MSSNSLRRSVRCLGVMALPHFGRPLRSFEEIGLGVEFLGRFGTCVS
jgi:hypothetical protein